MTKNELREKLAAEAHTAWSGWMRYLFSKCESVPDIIDHIISPFCYIIPQWAAKRWNRQMMESYAELPEEEKESDRKEADRYLAIMTPFVAEWLDEFESRDNPAGFPASHYWKEEMSG